MREAAWPLIRTDLGLSYLQIGVLLTAPRLVSNLIEPAVGILGDVWDRRRLILGGGVVFAAAVAMVGVSPGFVLLLFALGLLNPASGAFVGLSQASLMDSDPARHEQNMARWTLAGWVGLVLGSLALALAASVGLGWRGLFLGLAVAAVPVLGGTVRLPLGALAPAFQPRGVNDDLWRGVMGALRSLRDPALLRWLALLELSDLMLDSLFGYLALYLVDVSGTSVAGAAMGVAVWTGAGLLGNVFLIPVLERVQGLTYLRLSALAGLVLFPSFLVVPAWWAKLPLLAVLGFANAGWYPVLQAQVYSAMPGRSGTVLAVQNVSGIAGSLFPLGLGATARAFGLGPAMWLLLAGPAALFLAVPCAGAHGTRLNGRS